MKLSLKILLLCTGLFAAGLAMAAVPDDLSPTVSVEIGIHSHFDVAVENVTAFDYVVMAVDAVPNLMPAKTDPDGIKIETPVWKDHERIRKIAEDAKRETDFKLRDREKRLNEQVFNDLPVPLRE
jgi:hypothetical protein